MITDKHKKVVKPAILNYFVVVIGSSNKKNEINYLIDLITVKKSCQFYFHVIKIRYKMFITKEKTFNRFVRFYFSEVDDSSFIFLNQFYLIKTSSFLVNTIFSKTKKRNK